MRLRRYLARRAAGPLSVALAAVLAGAAGTVATPAVPVSAVSAASAASAVNGPGRQDPVAHSVAASAQAEAKGYWSQARMESATPGIGRTPASLSPARPATIPNPVHFAGVRTVGALFFKAGSRLHFCTASAVGSPAGDLVLTAAHCVYDNGSYATDIAFVPQWHDGLSPYGEWTVSSITVARGWVSARDPDLDSAFLAVAPQRKNGPSLQQTTGALRLGVNAGFSHKMYLIGYNDADNEPVGCSSTSTEFNPAQMQVYCNDYRNGTSGGPWILGFNRVTGAGTVFGDIGGYQQGGNQLFLSYSPYYGSSIGRLYQQAQRSS
jgi:V8-like Glu-specific endopeptidase